jgi:hypothetical protein
MLTLCVNEALAEFDPFDALRWKLGTVALRGRDEVVLRRLVVVQAVPPLAVDVL